MGNRVALSLALGIGVWAAVPSSSLAAGVDVTGSGEMIYAAEGGETNIVSVSFSGGDFTVTETGPGVGVDPGPCAQAGDDVTCTANSIIITLGDSDDLLTFTSSTPTQAFVDGGGGSDTLTGGPGAERLVGDIGTDTITGGDGNDALEGGDGNDQFEIGALSGLGTDSIDGGAGDDRLFGGDQPGAGVTPGAQTFSGGPGRDLADYSARSVPLTVNLDGQVGDGQVGEQDNIGADVEDVIGGAAGDILAGNDLFNQLDGGGGDDVLAGGFGGDVLLGGFNDAGSDTLEGGAGDDTGNGGPGDDGLRGGDGSDTVDGAAGSDVVDGGNGDDAVWGGAGSDSLTGGPGDDGLRGASILFVGPDGSDTLKGEEGNDGLVGEGGDDTLDGGSGSDALGGGDGNDRVDYQLRFEAIAVTLDGQANDGAAFELDNVFEDVENMTGGRLGDDLSGSAGTNAIDGGTGEDYLDGGASPDDLAGGSNGDVLRSRDGAPDRLSCGDGPDFVVADSADVAEADCDRVDRGNSRPQLAKIAVVQPTTGTLGMSPKGIQRLVPLRDKVGLPVGSRVDAKGGTVLVASARDRRRRQSGRFAGAVFQILQRRGRRPVTDIVLKGGDFAQCRGKSTGSAFAAQRRRRIRRVFGNARGRFRTRGRYSAATVRGTRWVMEDRCDGTLTRVRRGTVLVRDFRRRRTVVLKTGQSYLARAPRGK